VRSGLRPAFLGESDPPLWYMGETAGLSEYMAIKGSTPVRTLLPFFCRRVLLTLMENTPVWHAAASTTRMDYAFLMKNTTVRHGYLPTVNPVVRMVFRSLAMLVCVRPNAAYTTALPGEVH